MISRTHHSPKLKVATYEIGDVRVCRFIGDLDMDNREAAEFALEKATARLPRLLCLDLTEVPYCEGHTVGTMLRLSRRLPLALINPSHCVARAVDLLDDELSLRLFTCVEDAINAIDRTEQRFRTGAQTDTTRACFRTCWSAGRFGFGWHAGWRGEQRDTQVGWSAQVRPVTASPMYFMPRSSSSTIMIAELWADIHAFQPLSTSVAFWPPRR